DVADSLLRHLLGPADVVLEEAVPPVDDRVARLEQRGQGLHRLLGGPTGGDHDPHRPGLLQLCPPVLEAPAPPGAPLRPPPPPPRRGGRHPASAPPPRSGGRPFPGPAAPGRPSRPASPPPPPRCLCRRPRRAPPAPP